MSLSGTWIGVGGIAEGVFYLYQSGSCVWWSGGYPTSRTAEEQRYDELGWVTFVFMGTLTSDFTVGGTWSVVRLATEGGNRHWGTVTYALDVSDPEGPILRRTALVGERGVPLPETMTRVSEQAVPPP